MRLKKIEVVGFKSFADRQVIGVDDCVTGVIGPNGCGKSNIVDAVRWCMGEQSAKHLRGSGMADVIFAGSSTRGPAGMAEVTLTLENEGEATGILADLPEIAISRRLFADGTSEYLINKVPSRLRDITDLLMGTGVGTKGYSIIEQGQVGRIVSSKPEERRHIIDEAAGITRFKAQKAAAERKIEATRQNLLRTSDVITELEARLSTLRRQAQKAERYKRYKAELRDLDLWTASHKYLELQSTGAVLETRRDALRQAVGDLRTSMSAREAQIEAKRASLAEVEQQLAERQQQVFDLDNRVRLLEAEEEYRRRERESQQSSAAQAKAEADVAQRGLDHIESELSEVQAQREAMGDGEGPDGEVGAVQRLQEGLTRIERAAADEHASIESARVELGERRAALAGAEARRQSHDEARAGLRERLGQLEAELAELEAARAENRRALHQARSDLDDKDAQLARLHARRQELDRQRSTLREQVAAAEVELDTKRAEVHRCRSRLQSLEEIQSRYRGCHSGVQVVMEHRRELQAQQLDDRGSAGGAEQSDVVFGILADYVSAPQHLETAVSAVLGDRLEGVVVDGPAIGAAGVELLKRKQEGRTTFLPRHARIEAPPQPARVPEGTNLGWSPPSQQDGTTWPGGIEIVDLSSEPSLPPPSIDTTSGPSPGAHDTTTGDATTASSADGAAGLLDHPGVLGRLSDLVEVTGELGPLARAMLGDAVVVDGLPTALELWDRLDPDAVLVTLDGDRIEPTGVVVGGSPTALNSALLQQKREIRELQEILEELQDSFESTRGRHLALAQQLAEVEAAREANEAEVLQAEKDRVEQASTHARLHDEDERQAQRHRELSDERSRVADDLQRRTHEVDELDAHLSQSRSRIAELQSSSSASEQRLAELTADRDRTAGELTDAKVALARWQQQTGALEETVDRLLRQAESERQRIARLREAAEAAGRRVVELDEASTAATTERASLVEQSKAATASVHEARERFEALRLESSEIEASLRTLRGDLEEKRERLQEVELGLQEIGLERQHLLTDTVDRFDAHVTEVLVDYHDRPLAGTAERSRQKELKRILSRMGEVNLTAIDEFDEVSQRYDYLTGQRADLENAIAQLQEAIDRINKTTRERFRETFAAVDEKFRMLFPRLFNGGRAELKMTDPSDLLTTGVEIVAQPPGKQLRSLDLLSGGEKALTAVSLIFAIFLIKPSPFCVLDEVDAPLDDANVGRFCQLVRELASTTQFIIITHNKVTMEMADRLYGVTMEQRGVSKLVSVNMRRAVELAYN